MKPDDEEDKTGDPADAVQSPPIEEEPEWIEVTMEDRVLMINPVGDDYKIWVIHQAASRMLRKDIVSYLSRIQKEFEDIDVDDLNEKVEANAVKLEKDVMSKLPEKGTSAPVFDFEIN